MMSVSCTRAQDQMLDWIHRELPAGTSRMLEAHLDSCAFCQQRYEELLSLTSELAALEDPPPPADLPEQILRAVEREAGKRRSRIIDWRSVQSLFSPWIRIFALRVVPAALTLIAALWVTRTVFWPESTHHASNQELVFQLRAGVKRVTLGGLKQQALRIPEISKEFPEAATDVWGQPIRPDYWSPPPSRTAPSSGSE